MNELEERACSLFAEVLECTYERGVEEVFNTFIVEPIFEEGLLLGPKAFGMCSQQIYSHVMSYHGKCLWFATHRPSEEYPYSSSSSKSRSCSSSALGIACV
ncbi:MAG TPA: hypothetical protein DCE42_01595, partial [Myxococcales bacterium]|nr:hypothetical protein [Myxococcales bacterium]